VVFDRRGLNDVFGVAAQEWCADRVSGAKAGWGKIGGGNWILRVDKSVNPLITCQTFTINGRDGM